MSLFLLALLSGSVVAGIIMANCSKEDTGYTNSNYKEDKKVEVAYQNQNPVLIAKKD